VAHITLYQIRLTLNNYNPHFSDPSLHTPQDHWAPLYYQLFNVAIAYWAFHERDKITWSYYHNALVCDLRSIYSSFGSFFGSVFRLHCKNGIIHHDSFHPWQPSRHQPVGSSNAEEITRSECCQSC